MIVRLSFVVAASLAAYAVRQANSAKGKKASENENERVEVLPHEEQEEKFFIDVEVRKDKFYVEEEEEEEEVSEDENNFPLENEEGKKGHKEEGLLEFEEPFSEEIEFPLDDIGIITDPHYATNLAITEAELERLRGLVMELEEREMKLETELLEYYGLKEQESDILELHQQLRGKTNEIEMLHMTINSLQEEMENVQEEIMNGIMAKNELEVARNKIAELQRQNQLEVSQTKEQLMMLKQHVSGLQQKEEEAEKMDFEIQKKLEVMKDLEVEAVELRRKNKELQHEKRELSMKLDAAEDKISALSSMNENELSSQTWEDMKNLRHMNEDLTKQVEGLQINRFSEVEELVYLRWVNACLRYELRNYQTPTGRSSACDLNKSPSPKSQEKAKRLLLEYAVSERGQGDTDFDSTSSVPSSPGSDEFDTTSIDSSVSKMNALSRKPSFIQKLKRWGKNKDDYISMASPNRIFGGNSPRRFSTGSRSSTTRGSLEALVIRNAGDSVAITTFGQQNEFHHDRSFPSSNAQASHFDAMNSVAESFQLMSKTVEGVADDKYPEYKDRHKLAIEREKSIKEKAEKARAEKYGDSLNVARNSEPSKRTWEKPTNLVLPPKVTHLNSKVGRLSFDTIDRSNESENEPSDSNASEIQGVSKMKLAHVEKRSPRVPRPPPKSLGTSTNFDAKAINKSNGVPPPPPPPPPPRGSALKDASRGKVHRAPEVVEFYQSLMKRDAKNTSFGSSTSDVKDARSNMIGEIANRSTFLLAVKADVDTQGDFVNYLATEVRAASFSEIEDLVSFVNWLDEELSFLVDERAVLKHFNWPEGKADALREAAFEYQDLKNLENQASTFLDDTKLPCEPALKKMYTLLEKMEQSVYALLRTRDMAISRYRDFGFPVDWLMDSGVVGKIKLASVQLARKYMKRVTLELDAMVSSEKEQNREFLILQGVRFAFRAHQSAGGFDAESMQAFEDLRSRVTFGTSKIDNPNT